VLGKLLSINSIMQKIIIRIFLITALMIGISFMWDTFINNAQHVQLNWQLISRSLLFSIIVVLVLKYTSSQKA
jgi:hypothetical protein